jgi:thiosulfate/3-mercaptopyruvate sulfurtransferase
MTEFTTLIEPHELAELLESGAVVVVDCRYYLEDADAAYQAYRRGHIPGAVYVHLSSDLSGPPLTDRGRHPLPSPEALNDLFARLGISQTMQVVAYDDGSGIAAARLWWLLNFMGHERAAVLNGGLPAWISSGFQLGTGIERNPKTRFEGSPQWDRLVVMDDVKFARLLVDSRSPERYLGESEFLDPVAGHIPEAVNYYHGLNLSDTGEFLPRQRLREQFADLLGETAAEETVFYCGSGVTACNNLLALLHAGYGHARLYVGSWSEWCRDPDNPVVTSVE